MCCISVLYHSYMKLPRQQHDCRHGQEKQPKPLPAIQPGRFQGKQRPDGRHRCPFAEDIPKPIVQPKSDKQADRKEGHQLEQGLKSDCGYQSAVALIGVEVASAEKYSESCQGYGDVEGSVQVKRDIRMGSCGLSNQEIKAA